MTAERWQLIKHLYHAALEHDANERAAFLTTACGGDEALRREVESLLRCDARAEHFIERPALEVAARLGAEEVAQSSQAREVFERSTHIDPSPPESGSLPVTPACIGDYRLIGKIGEGGMGIVYEAEQQRPRRPVALKVIRGGRLVDRYQVKLFQREVQALARLKHPGIAAIYESGSTDEGQHYFAMELVRGIPLMDCVKGRRHTSLQLPIGIRQRLELFLKICDAISYAHQRGVIHRDLKPANILVAYDSEGQGLEGLTMSRVEVKVLDFGLARITEEGGTYASGLSEVGQIKGTFPYMSPEQVRGNPDEIDVRTDIYTLGVILYELLTGRLPYEFEHATLPQAVRIICEEPPKSLSRVWNDACDRESRKIERIDRDLETIVLKALEKDPERRYQSAAAMAEDVTRYLTKQPIQARQPSTLYQFRKLVARHKTPFALLAVMFVLLLGFAITMAVQSARITRERDKATQQEQANRRLLYAAHMNLAQQAWETADIGRMEEMLSGHVPQPGQEDLRGFEWYYLWRLSHSHPSVRHEEVVTSVAFSPDGKTLATGSWDDTAKLWEVATGRELITFRGHTGNVQKVAFSPDGKTLATSSNDKTVKLWEVATGRELIALKHPNWVWSVAFSPDGKRLASGCDDQTVRLWEVATGQEVGQMKGGGAWFSLDGKILATAGRDSTVRLWEVATGKELIAFRERTGGVRAVAFSLDGKTLATITVDNTVKLCKVGTWQELITLRGHTDLISSVAFSPDGKRLASGSYDHTVKLWEVATGRELTTLKGHAAPVTDVEFSPDGKLVSGSRDWTVVLWEMATGQEVATLKGHTLPVFSVVFSPDGKRLASGSEDRTVKLWEVATGQELATFHGHAAMVWPVAFSPDGKRLASGSYDHTVKLWEVATGQELATLKGHANFVTSVAFSPDGLSLASSSHDWTAKLWEVSTGHELATLKGHVGHVGWVAFSPDGKRLATGSDDRTVKLWEMATKKELITLKGHQAEVSSVAFAPDSKTLATASGDKTVRLWEVATGRELNTLRGHTGAITHLAFSPDGKRLATTSNDGTVKLWAVADRQELITLKVDRKQVWSVAFSPDGKTLATGHDDPIVRLWRAATNEEVLVQKNK